MLTFSLKHDVDVALATWSAQQKQVRFAAAFALTRTAQDLQDAIRAEMPRNFTLRRRWVVQGIRIKPARTDYLRAEVYSKDPFMAIQETGGEKRSINKRVFDYGAYLAVPLDARRSKSDIVRKEDWPQNLIDPFILTARDGRKYLAVHQLGGRSGPRSVRTARGKQKRATGTRLMYTLVLRTQLRERLGMRRITRQIVEPRWHANFARALFDAISTARP
jgi:hypothetical protein